MALVEVTQGNRTGSSAPFYQYITLPVRWHACLSLALVRMTQHWKFPLKSAGRLSAAHECQIHFNYHFEAIPRPQRQTYHAEPLLELRAPRTRRNQGMADGAAEPLISLFCIRIVMVEKDL